MNHNPSHTYPAGGSIRTEEVQAYFDARAAHWDENCRHDPQKLAAIVTLAQVKEGCRVLDIACGTGAITGELLARRPAEVVGVDLSANMIAQARLKFAGTTARFVTGDILQFTETGFDVAVVYSAYPHFGDKAALARQVYGLLRPGGRFIVAHSESRQTINGRHSGSAGAVSTGLGPAYQEAQVWQKLFAVDLLGDNDDIYFFSGVKR